jgi:hypothetical protein
MQALTSDAAEQINTLHRNITELVRRSVSSAIEVGRLLSETKAALQHGEFTGWIKDNLIFSDRTARNYMRLYDNKDRVLQAESISEAYRLLDSKTETFSVFDYAVKMMRQLIDAEIRNDTDHPCEVMHGIAHRAVSDYLEYMQSELQTIPETPPENIEYDEWIETINRLIRIDKECRTLQNLHGELSVRYQQKIGKLLNEIDGISTTSTRTL